MVKIYTELFIKDGWHLLNQQFVHGPEADELWQRIYKKGHRHKSVVSVVTNMLLEFDETVTDCPPNYLDQNALLSLRQELGARTFDRIFGYWPVDSIDVWEGTGSKTDMYAEFGIKAVRAVALKV